MGLIVVCSVQSSRTLTSLDSLNQSRDIEFKDTSARLDVLCKLLDDPLARFKSTHQFEALDVILKRTSNLLVVLPTGGGKTMLYFMLPLLEPFLVSIVIPPLYALMNELKSKATMYKIAWQEWDPSLNLSSILPGSLLFVSVFNAGHTRLKLLVNQMNQQGLLARIVFDEVHQVLFSSGYRKEILELPQLLVPGLPVVMLTGTLSPRYEATLSRLFKNLTFETVRQSTVRPNLEYESIPEAHVGCTDKKDCQDNLVKTCIQKVSLLKLAEQDRAIIYCPTRQLVDLIFSEIPNACRYHSGMSVKDQIIAQETWSLNGSIMVCTSGFTTGIDHPRVKLVMVMGTCYSLEEFAQISGRAGRSGQHALVSIVSCHGFRQGFLDHKDIPLYLDSYMGALMDFNELAIQKSCIRNTIQTAIDGKGWDCLSMDSSVVPCANCKTNNDVTFTGLDESFKNPTTVIKDTSSCVVPIRKHSIPTVVIPSIKRLKVNHVPLTRVKINDKDLTALKDLIDSLKDCCWICSTHDKGANGLVKHRITNCPRTKSKCIICLSNHAAKDCPVKSVNVPRGNCYYCKLTLEAPIHEKGCDLRSAANCTSGAIDQVLPFVLNYYNDNKEHFELDFCKEFNGVTDLVHWLYQGNEQGWSNLHNVIQVLLQS